MTNLIQKTFLALSVATASPALAAEEVVSEEPESMEQILTPELEVEMGVLRELLLTNISDLYPRLDLDKIVFDTPKQSNDLVEIYGDFSAFGVLGRVLMRDLLDRTVLEQEGCNVNVGKTTMSISCDIPKDKVLGLN